MTMGGVPFYLNQLKKSYSIDQNIDHLFFNSEGVLFYEFDEVFSSLHPVTLEDVVIVFYAIILLCIYRVLI